jgi:hypothetical protein
MSSISINGLGQEVDQASTTKFAKPGVVYEDGSGDLYNYSYFSAYVSQGFNTYIYEEADGVRKATKCATTSTTMADGGVTLCNVGAGYYAFTKTKGPAEAYFSAACTAGMPLTNAGAGAAGNLAQKLGGMGEIIARAVDTGGGEATALATLYMCIAKA